MKRFILVIVFIVSILIIVGIGIYQIINKQTQSDNVRKLFEMKAKCASLREGLQKNIDDFNEIFDSMPIIESLGEVFYSPKLNTCLYTKGADSTDPKVPFPYWYSLIDALTNKEIYTTSSKQFMFSYPRQNPDRDKFEAKIMEYR